MDSSAHVGLRCTCQALPLLEELKPQQECITRIQVPMWDTLVDVSGSVSFLEELKLQEERITRIPVPMWHSSARVRLYPFWKS